VPRNPQQLGVQRPEGKHPARSRRKKNRRARPLSVWETPRYWNVLTVPAFLGSVVFGQALLMSPLYVEMPFLVEHPWLMAPIVIAWLGATITLLFQPCAHLFWNVGDDSIMSTQPGRNGSYSRSWPNQGFTQLQSYGPVILARLESGEAYLWPRWLRRGGQTYAFELRYGRLRLRPLPADGE
jgi:hypothetical protein